MLSIIIVSHGNLSKALVETAEMVLGKQENLSYVGMQPEDSPEILRGKIIKAIHAYPDMPICLFTDILAGTPFNTAAMLSKEFEFLHISGINLPILVEALISRNHVALDEFKQAIMAHATNTIVDVSAFLDN